MTTKWVVDFTEVDGKTSMKWGIAMQGEFNQRFEAATPQYILSVIKSDLPIDNDQMPIYFPEEEIVLKLHDRDKTGTLFGFEF